MPLLTSDLFLSCPFGFKSFRPTLAAALGREAKRRFAELFTLDRMVEGTLGVYQELGIETSPKPHLNGDGNGRLAAAQKLPT